MFGTRSERRWRAITGGLMVAAACAVELSQNRSLGEPTKADEAMFRQLDASGDGVLTMDEATVGTRSVLERHFKEAGKKPGDRMTLEEFLVAHDHLRSKGPSSGAAKTQPATESAATSDSPPKGLGFIDTSGDGLISRAEWMKFTQTFSKLDVDKDSTVSAGELEVTGGAAELLMKIADANGDDKIARVEWGKMVHSYVRLDENQDSMLSEAELKKVAQATEDAASGSASLTDKSKPKPGPTLWRGMIDGRAQIELLVDGNQIVGREIGRGGGGQSLGTGTFTMTGDGKSGNMDAVYTEGNRRGEVCLGIYQLDGDRLVWCVNNRGGRPQSFNNGNGNWLLTLNKVNETSTSGTQ